MKPGEHLYKFLNRPTTSLSPSGGREFMYISEERVKELIKRYPNVMSFWESNNVNYKINNKGFRSDFNFYPNKSLKVDIYLGCSITFGQEHIWENTWPYLVSKKTGNIIINLAIPGTGIERGFFDLAKYIDYYDVQNVFHFQPFYARYMYMSRHPSNCSHGEFLYYDSTILAQEEDFCLLPWKKPYIFDVMMNDDYLCYTYYQSINALYGLCSSKRIPYYFFTNQKKAFPKDCVLVYNENKDIYYWMDQIEDSSRIPARDLLHPSAAFMKVLSDHFIRLKQEHPSGFIPKFEDLVTKSIV